MPHATTPQHALPGSSAGPRGWLVAAIALAAWGAAVGSHAWLAYDRLITADDDAAAYAECARSVAQGHGFFVTRAYDGVEPGLEEPIRLWPPAYPLAMAPLVHAGVPAWHAGAAISAAAAAVFILMISREASRRLPFAPAVLLACAVALSPPLVGMATKCLSDALYLALAAGSVLTLAAGARRPHAMGLFLLAGVLAGAAWTTRNVAVSLPLGAVFFFVLLFGVLTWKSVVLRGLLWCLGFALASGWLVWRNLATFGKINPYSMQPSERSWTTNAADALSALATDLTGTLVPGGRVAAAVAAALLLVGGLCVLAPLLRPGPRSARLRESLPAAALLAYALINLIVVVASRSVYRWGEPVSSRHTAQVEWTFWLLAVAAAWRWSAERPVARRVLLGTLGVTLALQLGGNIRRLRSLADDASTLVTPAMAAALAREIPPTMIVVTDQPTPLRLFAGLHARAIPSYDDGEEVLKLEELQDAGDNDLLWGLVLFEPDAVRTRRVGEAMLAAARPPHQLAGFDTEIEDDRVTLRWVGRPVPPGGRPNTPEPAPGGSTPPPQAVYFPRAGVAQW